MSDQSKSVCNESVFQRIFKADADDLYKYLYYKYGNEADARDLMQEAFSKLWQNCRKVIPERARGFLFTTAKNLMLNDKARKKTADNYKFNLQPSSFAEDPSFIMEMSEFNEKLQGALAQLTEEQRVTLFLNKIEGKRHKEIAEMLNISRKAVEKRIYTALDKIRAVIGDKI